MAGYPCDPGCAVCCVREYMVPSGAGHLVGPDGRCIHLDEHKRCSIYSTRPRGCRQDASFHDTGMSQFMTWAVYVGVARTLCYKIQRDAGWKKPT